MNDAACAVLIFFPVCAFTSLTKAPYALSPPPVNCRTAGYVRDETQAQHQV
jgi:hypothetical protein